MAHYPFGCLGGSPQRLALAGKELWIVPILLTSAGYGAVGEVGVVALDAATLRAAGGTPRGDLAAAMQRLGEDNQDALDTAFLRARTV